MRGDVKGSMPLTPSGTRGGQRKWAIMVFIDEMKDTHLYKEYGPMFAHPQSALEARHIGKPINSFRKQWDSFMQWSGLQYENRPPYRRRPLYSLRHLYMEQRLIHGEVDLYALATNCGTSPEVIWKWYQELQSNQYASQLSRIIQRGD